MSDNPVNTQDIEKATNAINSLEQLMKQTQDYSVVQALMELLKIEDKTITIAGDKYTIPNLELITEYPNVNYTKMMVKNETWRKSVQQVFHLKDIDYEKIVGFMDGQFILKMNAHKRQRVKEFINGIRRESANAEIIPNRTRTKTFFGMR